MFFQAMVTVIVGSACATVDGLVNTVIAQPTPAPALLRTGRCAVGEANASVGRALAPNRGLQAKPVKNARSAVTLAVPGGNVLVLCLSCLYHPGIYFLYCLSSVLTAAAVNWIYRPEPKSWFAL